MVTDVAFLAASTIIAALNSSCMSPWEVVSQEYAYTAKHACNEHGFLYACGCRKAIPFTAVDVSPSLEIIWRGKAGTSQHYTGSPRSSELPIY